MHFEILVEDQSGKKALDILVPAIIGRTNTYKVHAYKGIGHIPKNMKDTKNSVNRILLENLPKILKGYGRTFAGYHSDYKAVVILVCDLDSKCFKSFREELLTILNSCEQKPFAKFCIAIEEFEAWFLGDFDAIKFAYPTVNNCKLSSYVNDSICGTWEFLADALCAGGSEKLVEKGYQTIGFEKSIWAEKISPFMNVENNNSPSFCYFRETLKKLS